MPSITQPRSTNHFYARARTEAKTPELGVQVGDAGAREAHERPVEELVIQEDVRNTTRRKCADTIVWRRQTLDRCLLVCKSRVDTTHAAVRQTVSREYSIRPVLSVPILKSEMSHLAVRSQSLPPDRLLQYATSRSFCYRSVATARSELFNVESRLQSSLMEYTSDIDMINANMHRYAIENLITSDPDTAELSPDCDWPPQNRTKLVSRTLKSDSTPTSPTLDSPLATETVWMHGYQHSDVSTTNGTKPDQILKHESTGGHFEDRNHKGSRSIASDSRRRPNGSQPPAPRKHSRSAASRTGHLRYPCVYHKFGMVDETSDCSTRKAYISQLRRHHERHNFFYCVKCFTKFDTSTERTNHVQTDMCVSRCVTEGCVNYDQAHQLEGDSLRCAHGKENSQRDQWRFLFLMVRPNDPVPDPDVEIAVGAIEQKALPPFAPPSSVDPTVYLEPEEFPSYPEADFMDDAQMIGREIRPRMSSISILPPPTPATTAITEIASLARQMLGISQILERDPSLLDNHAIQTIEWITRHTSLGVEQLRQILRDLEQRIGVPQTLAPLFLNTDVRRRPSSVRSGLSADDRQGFPVSPASANSNSYLQPGGHTFNPSPTASGSHSQGATPTSHEVEAFQYLIDMDGSDAQVLDPLPEILVMSPGQGEDDALDMDMSTSLQDVKPST